MRRWLSVVLVSFLTALLCAGSALADDHPPASDVELAQRYTPIFYFHPAEPFRPQPVEVIVEQARLRQSRTLWFDINVLLQVTGADLLDLTSNESHFLDLWYGDDGGSTYTNYSAHQAYYQIALSPEAGGPPVTVYAHVVRDEGSDRVAIQYWALYYYNDWFNKHEGDWEMVQVMLANEGEPAWVVLSQHHGGTRRAWSSVLVEDGTHPAVFAARGSHANYFVGDEVYPQGQDVGRKRIEIIDRTGKAGRVTPAVVILPDRAELAKDPEAWPGAQWLLYRGLWGERAAAGDFGGPLGPADKGEQWEHPYEWGMAQPLDTDAWYANRLRVEVVGAGGDQIQVRLTHDDGRPLPLVEELGSLAILHADPPAGEAVIASIATGGRTRRDVVAAWPNPDTGQVTRLTFPSVSFADPGRATLRLGPGPEAVLTVDGAGDEGADLILERPLVEEFTATWDAPDLIWVGGVLPAHQVSGGILLAVVASVVPTLGYVLILYWSDRYEKEPARLLTTAFVWGALPSVVLALLAELFFRLPLDLIGTRALEAARLGLLSPVLQEAVKGAVVVFISWRYRREFDGVLDGIVYGATAGFGFAMMGNLISYLGRFMQWGFAGLGVAIFAQGVVQAMNQALYTAVLGAGLGFAVLEPRPRVRWLVRVGAFLAAAGSHVLHNLLARTVVGLSGWTVLITLAGVFATAAAVTWSLARQRRWLRDELSPEVSEALYRTMTAPGGRSRAQLQALRIAGLAGLRRTRRLQELCAELAIQKARGRLRPDEPDVRQEIQRLRRELKGLAEAGPSS